MDANVGGAENVVGSVGGEPQRRPVRAVDRLGRRMRRLLGIRQRFIVEGVRYREATTEPLRRALSRKGSGAKEYDVRFADGATMRIRATAARQYADLVGARMLEPYAAVGEMIVPGARVLALESGTGRVGAWLAERVGPSGAVVALDRDEESIAYAQRRYGAPNVAYEAGGEETLAGELDGAFDGVLAMGALREGQEAAAVLRELWRVVGQGGWMAVGAPASAEGGVARPRGELVMAEGELISLVRGVAEGKEGEAEAAPGRVSVAPVAGVEGYAIVVAKREEME